MKILMTALIAAELFFLALLVSPVFDDNRSVATAFVQWRENPTPENKAKWLSEQKRGQRESTVIREILGVLLITNAAGIIFVGRRLRAKTK